MKGSRQLKIQEMISKEVIHTQEELAEKLRQAGFDVTQATVSRDIKEMGLIKVPSQDDEYRYAIPTEAAYPANLTDRLKRMLREVVVTLNQSENLMVIRTIPGNAHALASLIDNSNWPELLGTVAGDDTILLVISSKEETAAIRARLDRIMG